MPLSASGARVIDPILTTVAQGYGNQNFVGSALFPRVTVMISGGQILSFGREAFQLYNSRRAPGAATRRVQYGYLGAPYSLLNRSLEGFVPYEHMRDAERVPAINLGSAAVTKTMKAITLGEEVEMAALAVTSGNYPAGNRTALAGAAKWSASTGNPLTDIDAGREAIRAACGMYPNVAVLGATAFNAAKNNPNTVARFQYTSAASVTPAMLAGLWNIEKVLVGAAVYWSDAGVATDVWGNNAVLAYVPTGPLNDMDEPSYGYTYTMEGHPLAEPPYQERNTKSWVYPVNLESAPVLSGIVAGYLIQTPA